MPTRRTRRRPRTLDRDTPVAGLPVVAVVGRPNVGKSTLFNRIVGERQAIVEDRARTTRDRLYGVAEWNDRRYVVIDTGGIEISPGDDIEERVQDQARGFDKRHKFRAENRGIPVIPTAGRKLAVKQHPHRLADPLVFAVPAGRQGKHRHGRGFRPRMGALDPRPPREDRRTRLFLSRRF